MKKMILSYAALYAAIIVYAQPPSISGMTFPYKGDDSLFVYIDGEAYTDAPLFCDLWVTNMSTGQPVFNKMNTFIGAGAGYFGISFGVGNLEPATPYMIQASAWDSTGNSPYLEYASTTGTKPTTGIVEISEERLNEEVAVFEIVSGKLLVKCRRREVVENLKQREFSGLYSIVSKDLQVEACVLLR